MSCMWCHVAPVCQQLYTAFTRRRSLEPRCWNLKTCKVPNPSKYLLKRETQEYHTSHIYVGVICEVMIGVILFTVLSLYLWSLFLQSLHHIRAAPHKQPRQPELPSRRPSGHLPWQPRGPGYRSHRQTGGRSACQSDYQSGVPGGEEHGSRWALKRAAVQNQSRMLDSKKWIRNSPSRLDRHHGGGGI